MSHRPRGLWLLFFGEQVVPLHALHCPCLHCTCGRRVVGEHVTDGQLLRPRDGEHDILYSGEQRLAVLCQLQAGKESVRGRAAS